MNWQEASIVRRAALAALVFSGLTGCGGGGPETMDGGAPDGEVICASAVECDDGVFCNGAERCAPGDPMADARGCAAPLAAACESSQTCDEVSARCVADDCNDDDEDGYRAASCGGMDCDDADPRINPGATEVCDAADVDEDCDPATFGPRDEDGDGYLDALCCNENAAGVRACGDDCDDDEPGTHPDQPDICGDGIDNECDGEVDEGGVLYVDLDNDGRGDPDSPVTSACMAGLVSNADDCDDTRNETYGGPIPARELCDGLDNDCGNAADPGGAEPTEDMDGDEHSAPSASCLGRGEPGALGSAFPRDDCDDADPETYTGAFDLCDDGVDQDCDGTIDNPSQDICSDADGDGHGDPSTRTTTTSCVLPTGTVPGGLCDDCDDRSAASYPGNREICDRIDNDCSTGGGLLAAEDLDGDGYAPAGGGCATFNPADPETASALPGGDCDDTVMGVNPGAMDVCDGVDSDCSTGGGVALDEDADGDGHAPIGASCVGEGEPLAPLGAFPEDDCDDTSGTVHGGLSALDDAALCDGVDNDCDPATSEISAPCATGGYCRPGGVCGRAREVVQLVAGEHNCARFGDGTVECWGRNDQGEMGLGTFTPPVLAPTRVPSLSGVVELAAGQNHTCALLQDGTARCWGRNVTSQLGDGSATNRAVPTDVTGLSGVVGLTGGQQHSCALIWDGSVRCWGAGFAGQLGRGTTFNAVTPGRVSGLTNATEIAAGQLHTCARLSDGTVTCFGRNTSGQLGDGTLTQRLDPTPVSGLAMVASVDTRFGHTCARSSDGTMSCWGENGRGQLGDGSALDRRFRRAVVGLSGVTAMALSKDHTCAILADQTVSCWGWNRSGRLGGDVANDTNTPTPTPVPGLSDVTVLNAGLWHTCAVAGGSVSCWSYNGSGNLGDGTQVNRHVPTAVPGLSSVSGLSIASRGYHACVRLGDGTAQCWGSNDRGQLGDGTRIARSQPTPVTGLSTVVSVASGELHTCALLDNGTVRCWGRNSSGQLGDGSTTDRRTPITVPGLSGVVELTAGVGHTCARLASGTVSCWGRNEAGQLGSGDTSSAPGSGPTTVVGLTNVMGLATGDHHTCARLDDDTVRCWGWNSEGQLGTGDTMDRTSPTLVPGITGALEIVGGLAHTCARLADETVQCWGNNASGNLGDRSAPTDRWSPGPVPGLTGVVSLAAGVGHVCAGLRDDTVRCWGRNDRGQLGDGSTTNRTVPTLIPGLNGVRELAGGRLFTCALQRDGALRCWGAGGAGQLGNGTIGDRRVPTTVWSL